MMDNTETHTTRPDHDLLIEVNANVKNLTTTIQGYINSTTTQMNDHEARIRVVEKLNNELEGAQSSQKKTINNVSIAGGLIAVGLAIFTAIRG